MGYRTVTPITATRRRITTATIPMITFRPALNPDPRPDFFGDGGWPPAPIFVFTGDGTGSFEEKSRVINRVFPGFLGGTAGTA
jgi:hypothetical protein